MNLLSQNCLREIVQYPQAANNAVLMKFVIPFTERHWCTDIFNDETLWMSEPSLEINGHRVLAKKHPLKVKWTFECDPQTEEETTQIFEAFNEAVAKEISEDVERLEKIGLRVCPYMPLFPVGVIIDPETFEPAVSFCSYYGVIER